MFRKREKTYVRFGCSEVQLPHPVKNSTPYTTVHPFIFPAVLGVSDQSDYLKQVEAGRPVPVSGQTIPAQSKLL